jgi:hypothetical protein
MDQENNSFEMPHNFVPFEDEAPCDDEVEFFPEETEHAEERKPLNFGPATKRRSILDDLDESPQMSLDEE